MNNTPLVSVIMGAYNCEQTIEASLKSMLAQDYANLEVLVCDDGSRDQTVKVVQRLAAQDARIRLLRNESNRGLAATLNRCIEAAAGTYLARMDGDDISKPSRISRQVDFLESHPEAAFCGTAIEFFDAEGVWGRLSHPEWPTARDFLLRSPYAHPTILFRAAALRQSGGYVTDKIIGRSEDYELFMRLHASGLPGANLQEALFEYREETGSFRKRKFHYALTEARVRWRGFRSLGLLPWGLPFVLKPIFIGLAPRGLYIKARKAIFGGLRRG